MSVRRISWLTLACAGLSTITLSACVSSAGIASRYPGGETPAPRLTQDAETLARHGDLLGAARAYDVAAATASADVAIEDRLRGAALANRAQAPELADAILDKIPGGSLSPAIAARYRLLRAQTALARNDPQRALRFLPPDNLATDPAIAEQQLLARSQAFTANREPAGLAQALVLRERYLKDPAALAQNRDLLWSGVEKLPVDSAALTRAKAFGPTVAGWLELAQLAQRSASLQDYDQWRKRHPNHPGEERLANLYFPTPRTTPAPAKSAVVASNGATPAITAPPPAPAPAALQATAPASPPVAPPPAAPVPQAENFSELRARGGDVALLLPQTAALLPASDAVRAGFNAGLNEPGTVRSYDSGAVPATEAYRQAIRDGNGVAVGPLLKEGVAQLAQSGGGTPILALNYLDAGARAPAGFYQFGLAPEDEARAAAEDAAARGLTRVLAMASANEWGNRVLSAFEQRFRELGGKIVEASRFTGEPQDWSDPVRKLLRYRPIEDKKKAAEERAKAAPGIDPQRRNDFDAIFLAARAGQARVLWPLFRYYHAERVPGYATAAIYDGNGDNDLAGLRFCDAPWVFDGDGHWSTLRAAALSGRSFDNARLYALGADAAMLTGLINGGQLHVGSKVSGATGALQVDGNGAVHRGLQCAQVSASGATLLGLPDAGR